MISIREGVRRDAVSIKKILLSCVTTIEICNLILLIEKALFKKNIQMRGTDVKT